MRLTYPRIPPKQLILAEIKNLLRPTNRTIGDTSKYIPAGEWLIEVLASLNMHHQFFARDYVAPKRVRREDEFVVLDGHEAFFDGLPPPNSKVVKASAVTHNKVLKI